VDGCIPSDLATGTTEELEEERRLLYVAMTRAKDDLTLVQPMRYYVRGQAFGSDKHVYAPRSRFIADEDIRMFEVVTPMSSAEVTRATESTLRVDLKSKIRSMW
jgi:DNA helicase-2/ATP-dependent DNA helicase PcrA